MKRVVLTALIVGTVGLLGLTAYAYASGRNPFVGRRAAECPKSVDSDGNGVCDRAAECHKGGSDCTQGCPACPDFRDANNDGRCDHIGTCDRHGDCGCPGRDDCPGREGCPGHSKGGCGRHRGARRGCAAACAQTSQ